HATPDLHVVGLNSVRPWRHQSGAIRDHQLAEARQRLDEAHDGALRVVALHHQLISAPWRTRKKPVARRSHVLAQLADYGAELVGDDAAVAVGRVGLDAKDRGRNSEGGGERIERLSRKVGPVVSQ